MEERGRGYIERDEYYRRVRGEDESVPQDTETSEAAEQISSLCVDSDKDCQSIVTIAQAQEWLSKHIFPCIVKDGKIKGIIVQHQAVIGAINNAHEIGAQGFDHLPSVTNNLLAKKYPILS